MATERQKETWPDAEAAIRAAIALEYPDREFKLRQCSEEPTRIVFRAYFPVRGLRPSPYVIYAFDKKSGTVVALSGELAKPYQILNYK